MQMSYKFLLCKQLYFGGFLGGSKVKKNPSSIEETQETGVLSLGLEDPLKEEMVTHSNILAGKIPWIKEAGGL